MRKMLVVDDDNATRMAISELLDDMNQPYELANSGPRCLALLVSDPRAYSMVLMDIHMPVLSGLDTVSWLRNSEVKQLRNIPVFALTADMAFCDAKTLTENALSGVLRKPITRGDLEQILVMDNA